MTDSVSKQPFFAITGFRFRLWPILLAAVLMQGILVTGRESARALLKAGPDVLYVGWIYLAFALFLQAVLAFAGILVMRRLLPEADDHVRWPPEKSYAGLALLIGIGMGLAMLIADYWPALIAGHAPAAGYDIAPVPAAGMLAALLCTGFAEETLFRGLLVGMLVILVPGRMRIGGLDLPIAAYIVALLFGLAHWESFLVNPLHLAIAQQLYAFIWGLIYVWLMERSQSLVAPIIAHGVGNFTEVGIVMAMMATMPPMAP
ncbi:CPBP family intramembrane glutamic endopeptidase [Parasphingopyxis marina]|uniref:CPBP family intramembrane metalloprotease n=1 Tax=Parasphingopyxis marina TaxID=2761622 RepID=A0A842HXV6_9SPHN|nr:CPBP family intramembrane glutamic endopeptidase [Parasphingopyxis marina]MBC2779008.1 CPBP family intramembrane metalloprotease [Parasphingopyxis marina]